MSEPEPTGTVDVAIKHAARLLDAEPALAAEQAIEILKAVPNHPAATLLLAAAHRRSGNPAAALQVLEPLLHAQARWAVAHYEQGLALAAAGRGDEAIRALRNVVRLKPDHPDAWRVLADHLMAVGDTAGADAAYARHIQCSTRNPLLQQAAAAMLKNDIPTAEALLKSHLKQVPTDVPAIRMLAEVAVRCGQEEDAERLLVRCLELAPTFAAARYNYATLLHRRNKAAEALVEAERLLLGQKLGLKRVRITGFARIYGPNQRFLGLVEIGEGGRTVPHRMLAQEAAVIAGENAVISTQISDVLLEKSLS